MARARRGCFISFEGGEGCGKSTQVSRLVQVLERRGVEVVATREPGGTPVAEAVRRILFDQELGLGPQLDALGELLLLEAARHEHVRGLVLPALERGATVIADRFADSSVVYQGVVRGLGVEQVLELNRLATGGLEPDITLVLDIEPAVGLERVRDRAANGTGPSNWIDEEPMAFHDQVRQGYLSLARRFPDRIVVVDAEGDADRVEARIHALLTGVLPEMVSAGDGHE